MSQDNDEDQRKLWKELRHGMHYGMGAQVSASLLSKLESSMHRKFITTGGVSFGKNSLSLQSNYAQLKFHHVLANTQYEMTGLMLAKIKSQVKEQAHLMRQHQMLPLTFFNGGYYARN